MKFSTGKFPFSCTHEKTFLVGFSRKKNKLKNNGEKKINKIKQKRFKVNNVEIGTLRLSFHTLAVKT